MWMPREMRSWLAFASAPRATIFSPRAVARLKNIDALFSDGPQRCGMFFYAGARFVEGKDRISGTGRGHGCGHDFKLQRGKRGQLERKTRGQKPARVFIKHG